jgi:hypothetical protein
MREIIIGLSALGLIAGSAPALAATQCRDAKGKFIKCQRADGPPKEVSRYQTSLCGQWAES